jgi:beta-glucoside operon transcriptional antiterminator
VIYTKIEKILNNNVITVFEEASGLEKVIMGRGIAFNKKVGNEIEADKIEKIFSIENSKINKKFQKLASEIPIEYINISEKIISHALDSLDRKFNDYIYVSLTDHLAFAITRSKSGIELKNHLLWEIQRIHHKEYEVGLWAIRIIKEELEIDMPVDEAGFIALHLVNASIGETMSNTMNITNIIQDILNIIKYYFSMELNQEDLSYDRLVNHLKFFAQRVITKRQFNDGDDSLLEVVKEKHQKAYGCAVKIKGYIEKNYDYTVKDEELIYLTIHLQRVSSRT